MKNKSKQSNQKILLISIISIILVAGITLFLLFGKPLVGFAGYTGDVSGSAGVLVYDSVGNLMNPLEFITLASQTSYNIEVIANLGTQDGKVFKYTLNYNPTAVQFYPFYGQSYINASSNFTIISETLPSDNSGKISIVGVVNPPYNLSSLKAKDKGYVVLGKFILSSTPNPSGDVGLSISDVSVLDQSGINIITSVENPTLTLSCAKVDYGVANNYPTCDITCDDGYTLTEDNRCLPESTICVDEDNTYTPNRYSDGVFSDASLLTKSTIVGSPVTSGISPTDECYGEQVREVFCQDTTHYNSSLFDCPTNTRCVNGACVPCGADQILANGECKPKCVSKEFISCASSYMYTGCGPLGYDTATYPCPTNTKCDSVKGCITNVCIPNCTGKACGDNGCGGVCGTCGGTQTCIANACVSSLLGDVNGDGCITFEDISALAESIELNYVSECANPDTTGVLLGDTNNDDCITFEDISALAESIEPNYVESCTIGGLK
ncbi:MAG: hypothetical protein WCV90_07490 [Candidatus Woesearchaeota archaeon]